MSPPPYTARGQAVVSSKDPMLLVSSAMEGGQQMWIHGLGRVLEEELVTRSSNAQ